MRLFTSLVVYDGLLLAREKRVEAALRGGIAAGSMLLGVFSECALAGKHTSALGVAPVYLPIAVWIPFAGSGGRLPLKREKRFGGSLAGPDPDYSVCPCFPS